MKGTIESEVITLTELIFGLMDTSQNRRTVANCYAFVVLADQTMDPLGKHQRGERSLHPFSIRSLDI